MAAVLFSSHDFVFVSGDSLSANLVGVETVDALREGTTEVEAKLRAKLASACSTAVQVKEEKSKDDGAADADKRDLAVSQCAVWASLIAQCGNRREASSQFCAFVLKRTEYAARQRRLLAEKVRKEMALSVIINLRLLSRMLTLNLTKLLLKSYKFVLAHCRKC